MKSAVTFAAATALAVSMSFAALAQDAAMLADEDTAKLAAMGMELPEGTELTAEQTDEVANILNDASMNDDDKAAQIKLILGM